MQRNYAWAQALTEGTCSASTTPPPPNPESLCVRRSDGRTWSEQEASYIEQSKHNPCQPLKTVANQLGDLQTEPPAPLLLNPSSKRILRIHKGFAKAEIHAGGTEKTAKQRPSTQRYRASAGDGVCVSAVTHATPSTAFRVRIRIPLQVPMISSLSLSYDFLCFPVSSCSISSPLSIKPTPFYSAPGASV